MPRSSGGAEEDVVQRELDRSWRRPLVGTRSTAELSALGRPRFPDGEFGNISIRIDE
jgi:hypothetical protein